MITIKSLTNTRFDDIFIAFNEAFKDYEMQLNKEELRTMLTRRGFVPELSFAAFDGEKITSFTLNGIGIFNGLKTAYDTGTGTLEAYRGQGLASKVFSYSVPFLKEHGISRYLLEVLQHNPTAISVYKKAGFEVSREFNYFVASINELHLNSKPLNDVYYIRLINLPNQSEASAFWDFQPSWQNNFDAVKRKQEDFKIFGTYKNQQLVGYCISEPISGDITQLAVDKKHRRKGIATALLKLANSSNRKDSIKIINTEINCESITQFLLSKGVSITGKQFEMIKQL
ncbi:GNAT family N-acetyltransferase [Sunxiuqinia sp. A32]|uniref:GNAT family N-acetyltransferase n=1 Tax=Sunxiuqinia sp. A32 TaxID=3461496 RepID=UPI0040454266